MKQRIFYLEPKLSHEEGHLLETLKILSPRFQQYGRLEIYGGSAISQEMASHYGIIPHFCAADEMPLITFLRNKRFIWRICNYLGFLNRKYQFHQSVRDLLRIVKKADDSSIFFLPTPNASDLLAALQIINRCSAGRKWIFILRTLPDPHTAEDLQFIFRNTGGFKNNCRFFSDSELIIREYQTLGLHDITLLPIPHLPEYRGNTHHDSLTLSYLGPVREEKGFDFLPDVIQYLQKLNSRIDFFIQASGFSVMWTDWERRTMGAVLEKLHLLAEKASNVTICEKHFESEDYYAHLNECDIILLPYKQRDKRYYATSGILAEAMALGKVAVVPAETWLARQIERSGGGVIFDSPEELPQKVEEAVRNFEQLHKKAVAFVPEWRNFHNIENYMKILMEN